MASPHPHPTNADPKTLTSTSKEPTPGSSSVKDEGDESTIESSLDMDVESDAIPGTSEDATPKATHHPNVLRRTEELFTSIISKAFNTKRRYSPFRPVPIPKARSVSTPSSSSSGLHYTSSQECEAATKALQRLSRTHERCQNHVHVSSIPDEEAIRDQGMSDLEKFLRSRRSDNDTSMTLEGSSSGILGGGDNNNPDLIVKPEHSKPKRRRKAVPRKRGAASSCIRRWLSGLGTIMPLLIVLLLGLLAIAHLAASLYLFIPEGKAKEDDAFRKLRPRCLLRHPTNPDLCDLDIDIIPKSDDTADTIIVPSSSRSSR